MHSLSNNNNNRANIEVNSQEIQLISTNKTDTFKTQKNQEQANIKETQIKKLKPNKSLI